MNLSFLNAFFLFGIAAAALPVIIHRITQKKVVIKKFSAVRLLLQSERIAGRSQRIKHIILLALRILAVAAIAAMMARPVLVRSGFSAVSGESASVLIVDNSLSMGYRDGLTMRYDSARKAAKELLESSDGQAALIPTVSLRKGQGYTWMTAQEAQKELENLPLTFGRGDPAEAFRSAYQLLRGLKIPAQIFVFSDMARSDWESLDLTRLGDISDAEITFFRMGSSGRDSNFAVKDIKLTEGDAVAGVHANLEVTVSNLGDREASKLVQVNLSGMKVDQKAIELKPRREGKAVFDLLVEKPGWVDGEIVISSDSLSADDTFYFPLEVKEKVKVLIVDGDPGTSLRASESYYLASALRPGGLEGSPFLTRVITEGEMARVDLTSYDAIFLLNIARPDFSRPAAFMERGRPIFLFLGDRIDQEAYNNFTLVPWQIRELKSLGENAEKLSFTDSDGTTPGFISGLGDSLKSASFHAYYKIEGTARNLLTLKNQDPILMEADAGSSRFFIFTSSADLDWNDLPLKAAYLPLIQGLVREAVGLSGASVPEGIKVGDSLREDSHPIRLRGPEGGPGIFQFILPEGEQRLGVNIHNEESDLSKAGEGELKKKFGAVEAKVIEYREGGLKELQGGRRELWPLLLGFLLVLLAFEMMLANGIPRLRFKRLKEAQ